MEKEISEQTSDKGGRRVLRFGVMCEEQGLTDWQARCIEDLLKVDGVEVALLIMRDGQPSAPPPAPPRRPGGKRLLWRVYRRFILDRSSQAARLVPWPTWQQDVAVSRVRVEPVGRFGERFAPESVADIRSHNLDFLLRFGFGILKGEVLEAARYGIWSFHHGDPASYRGMPPGFWEIHDGNPVTGAVLQRLTERLDAGVVLHAGHFQTRHASYVRSRDDLLFGTGEWPARICKEILSGNDAALHADPIRDEGPIKYEPGDRAMLTFLWRQARAWVANQVRFTFFQQQWTVGILPAPVHEVALAPPGAEARQVQWLPEPRGRFLADPFAVEMADRSGLLILAEDFDWNQNIGRVSAVRIAGGKASEPRLAPSLPYHLSYPYLVRHADRLYCIPESSQSGRVELHLLDEEGLDWNLEAILIEGRHLLDSTVFQHDGRWWLLATDADDGANLKLRGWFADDLHGPWQEHALNPLKTDVRSARPAGRPFVHEGALYRPAQDCSRVYGGGVAINRVTALSPTSFEEETVRTILPDPRWPYRDGFHTICGEGESTIIDACRNAFSLRGAVNEILRKARSFVRR
ncbi:hypothetical protein GGQ97_000041 [Sphingomonas kaistensis]|uniref:Glucosamine inositolphosphorylceramide transferase 1 N-terminal domain-containing protein n=1 Tax=Sphingomonas kaistensis TaxID=298708 RepID=A0A7X5Y3W2_9SPHN|nr:hypothetical protein [Sphingomonas kaistensis]NJC04248.1 hypothetical protein [Sphingomonas kaistensis]